MYVITHADPSGSSLGCRTAILEGTKGVPRKGV